MMSEFAPGGSVDLREQPGLDHPPLNQSDPLLLCLNDVVVDLVSEAPTQQWFTPSESLSVIS